MNNKLSWDDRMFELYGQDKERFSMALDAWETSMHPEDKQEVFTLLQAVLRGERQFDTEFRVLHSDGRIVYLKANGVVLRGLDGKPERMLGGNADITEEKLAKDKLEKAYAGVGAKVVERTAQSEVAKVAAENANKKDGHTLIRNIRSLPRDQGGEFPAVALTAFAEPRAREEAFASGFQEYLNKPMDAGILAAAILKLTRHTNEGSGDRGAAKSH